jgi:hypothetical protein
VSVERTAEEVRAILKIPCNATRASSLARALGVTRKTIYDQSWPYVQVGGLRFYDLDAIHDIIHGETETA